MKVTGQQEGEGENAPKLRDKKVFRSEIGRGGSLTEHLAIILKVRAGPVDVEDMTINKMNTLPRLYRLIYNHDDKQ